MRVVSPYRPFKPESDEHRELGPFDWVGALEMLRVSVERSGNGACVAITDVDTVLPGPSFRYVTTERRLMLWILEVCLRYLESDHFDQDTVMCSPDNLVFCDLTPYFAGAITVLMRPDHPTRPILNAVQWWPVAHQETLIRLYRKALKQARALPEEALRWGADTIPFLDLLRPLYLGCAIRRTGIIANLLDSRLVLSPLTRDLINCLQQGREIVAPRAVIDFRYTRKWYMRDYFNATLGVQVPA